ncbi:hypothetical protein NKI96_21240 [Mesorhizobium sp. M0292]|uniref:hypothetical protein n=1 Tax=Mesorhizobium sp. M0292 TaxID=2956929 RepID=UPI00333E1779
MPSASKVPQFNPASLPAVSAAFAAQFKRVAGLVPSGVLVPPAAPGPGPTKPGVERWPVKTGTDSDAGEVGTNRDVGTEPGIVDTTVEELAALARPADMLPVGKNHKKYQTLRARPVKLVVWRVVADIIVLKKEDDGDFHIVLQGASGETCIAEAPTAHPPFVDDTSPWFDAMQAVRRKIAEKFGPSFVGVPFVQFGKYLMPQASIVPGTPTGTAHLDGADIFDTALPFKAKVPATPVEVIGVGFFDRVHGQTGVVLNNGIELHPILSVTWK